MRDVVVIGGGLSGLAAAWELEKHHIPYTIIEVKPRFGGGITSIAEKGFVMDGCALASRRPADLTVFNALGLGEQIFEFGDDALGFRDGTESLIRALAGRLTGGRLMRMAVSAIGRWRRRLTICLENGLMFDAGALIVAAPARFAERMFYSFAPEISERLRGYRYDSLYRVSLGYHKRDLPARLAPSDDETFPFLLMTDQPGRVPDDEHRLIQAGLRMAAGADPQDLIQAVIRHYGCGENPIVKRVHYWPEADLLADDAPGRRANMAAVRDQLPAGVWLIGSDYGDVRPLNGGIARLDDRIRQGQQAARAAMAYRQARRNNRAGGGAS